MLIRRCLVTGGRSAVTLRAMVLLLFGVNAIAALPLVFSMRSALLSAFGPSTLLPASAKDFNFAILGDLMRNHGKEISASLGGLGVTMLLVIAVNIFMCGGMLAAVRTGNPSIREFFKNCADYVGRLSRLFCVVAAAGVLLAGVLFAGTAGVVDAVSDAATTEWGGYIALAMCLAVVGVVVFLFLLVDDYARIAVVAEQECGAWRACRKSIRFAWQNKGAVIGLQGIVLVVFVVLAGLYLVLSLVFGGNNGLPAFLALVLCQQVVVCVQWGLRVAVFGAETELYRSVSSEEAEAEVSEALPAGEEIA